MLRDQKIPATGRPRGKAVCGFQRLFALHRRIARALHVVDMGGTVLCRVDPGFEIVFAVIGFPDLTAEAGAS